MLPIISEFMFGIIFRDIFFLISKRSNIAPPSELLLLQVVKCYVNPCLSVVGFCANMMSIAILRRSGLRKPSNILLFGLVIADTMVQFMTMNFAEILQYFGPNMQYPRLCGWQYGNDINYFLLVSAISYTFFSQWGQYVNTTIPVFITLERFLAVFMPLTFKKIVTTKTASFSVIVSFLIWLPWSLYLMTAAEVYVQLSKVMFYFINAADVDEVFNIFYVYVSDILSSWVPIALVVLGCVLIAVKVQITLQERQKLTSKKQEKVKWSSQTTRTLLTTCVVFSISHIIYSFINYFIPNTPTVGLHLMYEFMNMSLLINASSNFFVYIASNRKLYIIFKQIIHNRHTQ
ncbi:hypothetical protein Btru_049625 [Bulinus truncatus]|nr:hypothetical protein Btru_049625 [Bulinus truncatus]